MRQVYGVVPGGVPPGVWGEWKPPHYRSNTHTHTHGPGSPPPLPPPICWRAQAQLAYSALLGTARLFPPLCFKLQPEFFFLLIFQSSFFN